MFEQRSTQTKNPRKLRIFILSTLGLIGGVFTILFMIVNNNWIVIRIPNAPWNPTPTAASYESKLSVIILVSLLIGGLAASLLWRLILAEHQKRKNADLANIDQLQKQLVAADRLAASLKKHSAKTADGVPAVLGEVK